MRASHFVERHGLVVIIAIGESIIAVGVGAAGRPVGLELSAVAVLCLALSAALWWLYFGGGDDERAEHALAAAPSDQRGGLAIDAFGYWHLLLLLGVIAIAAAEKKVVEHPLDPLELAQAVTLGAAVALFLFGDVLFRRSLGLGTLSWRAGAGVLALLSVPLGLAAAVLQLIVLVAVIAVALAGERRTAPIAIA